MPISRHYRRRLRKMPLDNFVGEVERALEICTSLPRRYEHFVQEARTAQGKTRSEFLQAAGIGTEDMDWFHMLEHVLPAEFIMLIAERVSRMKDDDSAPASFKAAFEKCIELARPIMPTDIMADVEKLLDELD